MTITHNPIIHLIAKYLFYFLMLLGLEALLGFDRSIGYTAAHPVALNAKTPAILHALWPTDFALYIYAAEKIPIFHLKVFTGDFGMYPPGLSYLEYVILKIWPLAPLYTVLFLISIGLWAIFMIMMSLIARRIFELQQTTALLLPLALLAFPFFTSDYLWNDIGLTECIATPLFAIGCSASFLLIIRPVQHGWIFGLFTGICFAISAYTRAQFDLILTGLMVVSCLWLLRRWILEHQAPSAQLRVQFFAILAIVFAYQAATIPYKHFKHAATIVSMDSFIWDWAWMNKDDATKRGIMTNTGIQSICEIAPEPCQQFKEHRDNGEAVSFKKYKHAALMEVLHNPVALLKLKLPLFWRDWNIDMSETTPEPGSWRWLSEYILLLALPVTCLYIILRNKHAGMLYGLYIAAFAVTCLGFSLILNIEPRYFLPVKLLSAVSLIFLVANTSRRRNRIEATYLTPVL